MAAEVMNKTLIQNETIILKRECRSKEIFKQLRYLNCLKKEILNSNFYTYYTRGVIYVLYMTGGESHSVRYMRATTKPLVRATSSDKRASPYKLAS